MITEEVSIPFLSGQGFRRPGLWPIVVGTFGSQSPSYRVKVSDCTDFLH